MTDYDRAVRAIRNATRGAPIQGITEADSAALIEAIAAQARSAREEGRRDALAAIEALDEEECGGTRGITRECYAHAVRSLSASPGTGKGGEG